MAVNKIKTFKFFSMTVKTVAKAADQFKVIHGGTKRGLELHAIDVHGQANKSMGYKVSRRSGTAQSGGESLMLPSKQGKVRGRARHDEFGLQKFAYKWHSNDALRVGPLRHGRMTGGDPVSVHEGHSGGRTVYKDRYLFKKKKRGKGLYKTADRARKLKHLGHSKGYALQRGGYSKPGYVITDGDLPNTKHNRMRYVKHGKTKKTKGRPYLVAANRKQAKYLDKRITRAIADYQKGARRKVRQRR